MSYAFGWWDFEDGAEPQMICRDTDERVVLVGAMAAPWRDKARAFHPEWPQGLWRRFEYRHTDFWFPLIVNWNPDEEVQQNCEMFMRLRKPRVERVESRDGTSILHFERFVPGRDGGALYRLTILPGGVSKSKISTNVLVTSVTSFYAADYARSQGLDFDQWSLVRQMDYQNEFAEVHGNRNAVREFALQNRDLDEEQIEMAIALFVKLFFEINSSFKFNKEPPEERGAFPDRLSFEPYDLVRAFHRLYRAEEFQA